MIVSIVILVAGIGLLVYAGDHLVKGAVGVAEIFDTSPLVIGLTIVAFGTSAPELFVSVEAALGGAPGISVGNVIGSNIANVLLVVGLPALVAPVCADEPGIRRNVSAMLALTVLFMWMLSDGAISRADGAVLFAAIVGFVAWQFVAARHKASRAGIDLDYHDEIGSVPRNHWRIALYIVTGLVGLPIGAHMTITGALSIAGFFGVSDTAIGLTIVAIGTSLPELATSFMAATRGKSAVAIGNVIGSNIFNIACIMGVTGLIVPVSVSPRIIDVDMWIMLAVSLVMVILAFGHMTARRAIGGVMTTAFAAYIISVF